MSIFSLLVTLAVTLICSVGFCLMSSTMSKATTGEPLRSSTWVFWVIGTLVLQVVLVELAFHPITYIILMIMVLGMILLSCRRRKTSDETKLAESPFGRLASWLTYGLWIQASILFSSAQLADKGVDSVWSLSHGGSAGRQILALLLPIAITAFIGLIVAVLNTDYEEDLRDAIDAITTDNSLDDDDIEDIDVQLENS